MKWMTIFVLLFSSFSFAHHDFITDVNFGSSITFSGTIMGIEWAEPHVLIRIVGNLKLPSSPEFLVQMDSPKDLELRGIDIDSFQVYDKISISGYRSNGRQCEPRCGMIYGLYWVLSPNDSLLLNSQIFDVIREITDGLKIFEGERDQ